MCRMAQYSTRFVVDRPRLLGSVQLARLPRISRRADSRVRMCWPLAELRVLPAPAAHLLLHKPKATHEVDGMLLRVQEGVHRLSRTAVFFGSQGALPERLIPGASEEVCMQQLLAGYATFRSKVFPQHAQLFAELADDQEPQALFITCCDSRVMPEMILQCAPGQILCCR